MKVQPGGLSEGNLSMMTERLVTGALLALMIGFIALALVAAALTPLHESASEASPDHTMVEHGSSSPSHPLPL